MTGDKKYHHQFGIEKGYAPIAHRVILIDFDATLFPWGELMNWDAKPIHGAVKAMQAFTDAGFDVRIFTSRVSPRWLEHSGNKLEEQLDYIVTKLKEYNIPFTEIIGEKVPAMAYVDDKAIEFTGDNWAQIQERVLAL